MTTLEKSMALGIRMARPTASSLPTAPPTWFSTVYIKFTSVTSPTRPSDGNWMRSPTRKGRFREIITQAAIPLTGACRDQPTSRPEKAPIAAPTRFSAPTPDRSAAMMPIPAATRSRLASIWISPAGPRRCWTEAVTPRTER